MAVLVQPPDLRQEGAERFTIPPRAVSSILPSVQGVEADPAKDKPALEVARVKAFGTLQPRQTPPDADGKALIAVAEFGRQLAEAGAEVGGGRHGSIVTSR